jgi:hypothetical protein
MKKILIVLIILIVLFGIGLVVDFVNKSEEEPVACTTDVKLCSDGSYVSRIPPECDFAPCPEED